MTSARSMQLMEAREEDDTNYLEPFIHACLLPLPNPFFASTEFVRHYLSLCDDMCTVPLILSRIGDILFLESRVLQLQSPFHVFGDLRGNMADLVSFSKALWPLGMHLTPGAFLFLGGYVGHGAYGLELLSYLFAEKVSHPEKVFLLRVGVFNANEE